MKDQDLGQIAISLKNHSVELKDEVEQLKNEFNDGKHSLTHTCTHK